MKSINDVLECLKGVSQQHFNH